jgi:hypothetical protein
MRSSLVVQGALALAIASTVVESQTGRPKYVPSAPEVASELRRLRPVRNVREALTQSFGTRSAQTLDELADTLVAIATTLQGNGERHGDVRFNALFLLAATSRVEPGEGAIAYRGAQVRVARIAETAEDVGIRGAAVGMMEWLPDREAALSFLERISKSHGVVADDAVYVLGVKAGPAGLQVARRLFLEGKVTNEGAKRTLRGLAQVHGWR